MTEEEIFEELDQNKIDMMNDDEIEDVNLNVEGNGIVEDIGLIA